MSSELLEIYEENLRADLRDVETLVSHTLPSVSGDELKRYIQQAESKLEHAETQYNSLQSELRKAPRSFQQEYNLTMARYKNELTSLKRKMISYTTMSARTDLLSRDTQQAKFGSTDSGYVQLMKNTETLQRASDSVYRAQQVSVETDKIADNIVEELGDQRQKLLRTRDRVHGFDTQMNQTRSLMRKIALQSLQNRIILIAAIIIEVIILGFVVWFRFFRNTK